MQNQLTSKNSKIRLTRGMGLTTLVATGVCSMLGASINVVPFMIQRNVEGIGPHVLSAFIFAAIPAILASLAYSILASAMPRAGGSYIYTSRGLNPYLGFVASFSQWFGLSIVIGVIAYITIPFIRDVTDALGWQQVSATLELPWVRVGLALLLIWSFVMVNINGVKSYQRALIPMMVSMFALGGIVIIVGFSYDSTDFLNALKLREGRDFTPNTSVDFNWRTFLSAAALLFSSFIGFDSIAQAGGEAKRPTKLLPRAILLAIFTVGLFYFLFTKAVYNTVPWSFVAQEAMSKDISAPGLLSYVMPSYLAVAVLAGAAIALINDLPAMLLSVSRLMFAWAKDGIFPSYISTIHPRRQTPHIALITAGLMATVGVLGSHFAGDFFLGIDIMVTSMMVNFLLMSITLINLPSRNAELANEITVIRNRTFQLVIGWLGVIVLVGFLIIHTIKDLTSESSAWYFYSTPVWLVVMFFASLIFLYKWNKMKASDIDLSKRFMELPKE